MRLRPLLLALAALAAACAPPRSIPRGSVPSAIEGFALGAAMGPILERLGKEGWELEREVRAGGRLVEYRGRHAGHRRLRYLRVSFADGRLYYVRVGFQAPLQLLGREYAEACDGRPERVQTGLYVQCVSDDRARAFSAGRSGDRVTLLDVKRAVAAGAATPDTVRQMLSPLQPARSAVFGKGPPRGPIPREAGDLRLGDALTDVLERYRPPVWKLRTFGRERGALAYRHVQLRSAVHPELRELLLDFVDRRLLRARLYFRKLEAGRVEADKALCDGHVAVPSRMGHAGCREGWKTLRAFDLSGRSLQLLDLEGALRHRFLSREEIDPAFKDAAPARAAPPRK